VHWLADGPPKGKAPSLGAKTNEARQTLEQVPQSSFSKHASDTNAKETDFAQDNRCITDTTNSLEAQSRNKAKGINI